MEVKRFQIHKDEELWNEFIGLAKNSTFLFNRDFMDYHSERFKDHSLLIYEKKKLIACFPANQIDELKISSHQGLTYGGVIIKQDLKLPVQIEIFNSILKYYADNGFKSIIYKAFPRFYNILQTDEIEYCLFINKAKLFRRDTAIAIDRNFESKYSDNIRREAKKAKQCGIIIKEDDNFDFFWDNVLIRNLEDRFDVKPVHSKEEIVLLHSKFPEQIKLYTAKDENGKILAGAVFFLTDNVAHCQYISANNEGRKSGALNYLFTTLIDTYFLDKRYFDLGIANEDNGMKINSGLLAWKERLGGRTYSHDFYEIVLNNNEILNNINEI